MTRLRTAGCLSPALARLALAGLMLSVAPCGLAQTPSTPALGLPLARSAEAAGFAGERLDRIDQMFNREVAGGVYAGANWLVIRDGQIVTHGAVGQADIAAKRAMTEKTVFRIMSMTKLITTATFLTLLEEGRVNLDDPIGRYLPALASPKVYVGGSMQAPQLVPAATAITIRQLLTQTSGYSYGFFDSGPIQAFYAKADLWRATSLTDFVQRAASLPLKFQPGSAWNYGINTDLLGAIIEQVTGQRLGDAMRERILRPLAMTDTGFSPPSDPARLATAYQHALAGGLSPLADSDLPPKDMHFDSGGGGLYSTLHDYARFAQMLLNGGALGPVRILGPKTVEMMTQNEVGYLNPRPLAPFLPQGFGFGVRVRLPDPSGEPSLGSPGRYGWEGILTTYVAIDPRERLILLMMTQHQPYDDDGLFERFTNTAYQAIVK